MEIISIVYSFCRFWPKHLEVYYNPSVGFNHPVLRRYMGSQSLVARTGSEEAAPSTENAVDLDPEIALHLRRLSKREAVTKLKALQVEFCHSGVWFLNYS